MKKDKVKEIDINKEEEKKGKKKWLLLLLLLFLFVFISIRVTYSINEDFKDNVDDMIINTLKVDTPTSPKIVGESSSWTTKELVRVEKDAKSYSGINYYEYCVSNDKDFSKCKWVKTETKNMVASTTGKYYVVFRGVSKDGTKGKKSNIEEVLIDNEAPNISNLEIEEKNNKIKITIEAKDKHSGIKEYYYKIDDSEYKKVDNNFEINDLDKEYTLTIKVEDKLGNIKEVSKVFKVDEDINNSDIETDNKDDNQVTDNDSNTDTDKENNNDNNNSTESDNDNKEDTNKPSEKPSTTDKPTEKPDEEEKEELIIPEINLNKVPAEFTYGESYELPSYVDFKGDTGEVSCIVEGKEYKDTSTLKIGKHLIVCNATSSKNVRVMVEKEVLVKVKVGKEEVMDGWIRLNLYYPENSTNWEWRLDSEGIRTGYNDDLWQAYTGPILVKIEDVENVYIRYDLNGETVIIPPKGKILVDIEPKKYSLTSKEKVSVKIHYDNDAEVKEYRINGEEWKSYNGHFTVEANTLIEARATKNEKVYNSDGEYVYTSKRTGTDSIFIGEETEEVVSGTVTGGYNGSIKYESTVLSSGITVTRPLLGSRPSTYLAGPIISSNPSSEIVESTEVSISTSETADKIYYSINNGSYQEYTGTFRVSKNCLISAYYTRLSDGKESDTSYYYVENIKVGNKPYVRINTTPSNYLSEDVSSVEVSISGSNYDKLEYSLDGVIYQNYSNPIKIEESKTVYARGVNSYGETVVSKVITTIVTPTPLEELDVSIHLNPSKEEVKGLVNKTTVSISYDSRATKKYYKLGYYGEWKEYSEEFEVTSNTTIYAYCTTEGGRGEASKSVSFLTTGISDPIINADTITKAPQVKVNIDYDKNASIMRYQIGDGPLLDYNGAFYVYENTTIRAYNKDVLGNEGESSITIKNIVASPNYLVIEKGKYYIIKLNYPETSSKNSREYKWKPEGTWKEYDEKGILLIKPEYKDEFDFSSADGIKVEDNNGNEVIFTDHYYLIDVPFSELS